MKWAPNLLTFSGVVINFYASGSHTFHPKEGENYYVPKGDWSFKAVVPKLWNAFPLSLWMAKSMDSFKMELKTLHLVDKFSTCVFDFKKYISCCFYFSPIFQVPLP